MSSSIWLQDLTVEDVRSYLATSDEIIVPIGSLETHGPHLPLGVDGYEAIDYSSEIAMRRGLLVTPPIWFGDNGWHMHGPGTIALQPETVIAVLKDVYASLIRHGFKSIFTFNGHRLANLPAISVASRAIKEAYPDAVMCALDPLLLRESHLALRRGTMRGIHGDEFETSHMLFKHPELVREEFATPAHGVIMKTRYLSVDHFVGGDQVQFFLSSEDQRALAPAGHLGDPTLASATEGELLFEAVVSSCCEFIDDFRAWKRDGAQIIGVTGDEALELIRREEEWHQRR